MRRLIGILAAMALPACASSNASYSPGQISLAAKSPGAAAQHLYVLNAKNVTVYNVAGRKLGKYFGTAAKGLIKPWALGFDATGNLYVATSTSVLVYDRGSKAVSRTISLPKGALYGFVIAPDGTINIEHGGSYQRGYTVGAYILFCPPGATKFAKKELSLPSLTEGPMTIDSAGNLYVGGGGQGGPFEAAAAVVVFPADGSASYSLLDNNMGYNSAIAAVAVNQSGEVFAAPYPSYDEYGVDEFPVGNTSSSGTNVQKLVKNGCPRALLFDRLGNLYDYDPCKKGIVIYAPGSTKPSRTIVQDDSTIAPPMAIDPRGDLYEATSSGIAVFLPNTTSASRYITYKIEAPKAMAIGP